MNKITAFIIALLLAMSASAIELPIEQRGNTEMFHYVAKKKRSVYALTRELGISRELLLASNPQASHGLKKGEELWFPVAEFSQYFGAVYANDDENDDIASQTPEDSTAVISPELLFGQKSPAVALLLPFGLNNSEPSRENKNALDFYRGFLLATKTFCADTSKFSIEVFDTEGSAERVQELLSSEPTIKTSQVIICPEDEASITAINDFAKTSGTYIFNVQSIRDTTFRANPFMIQGNIPAQAMYDKAAKAVIENYPDYHIVVIRNTNGRNEKEPFVNTLSELAQQAGVPVTTVDYSEQLQRAALTFMDEDPTQKFLIIPSSGTLSEFNKFAYVIKALRDSRVITTPVSEESSSEVITSTTLEVFGYPDWIAFRGDAEEMLHSLNATIYSRFYNDNLSFDQRMFNSDFKQWYGIAPIESIPTQAMLGYDTGMFIIPTIIHREGLFSDAVCDIQRQRIQSTFNFKVVDGGGFVNDALYLISFLPGGQTSAKVL